MPIFHFVCRVTRDHGTPKITASISHIKQRFLQNSKSMLFSSKCSSESANQQSFTVSYLINSCGLSLESALSASKYIHFETPEKPDYVLDLLRKRGFSRSQITTLTKGNPRLLGSNPEKTLLPKLEFFHSIGVQTGALAKLLSFCPYLLRYSLENRIIPNYNYISNLLQSREETVALVKRFPRILCHDLESYIIPNVKVLRDSGVPESNIGRFIDSWQKYIITNPKSFEEGVAAVKGMGINPSRTQFVVALIAKITPAWVMKRDLYRRWGWSDEEFSAAFAKYPWCMVASTDKITAAMEFFVNKLGWKSSVIAKYPILVAFSMEKRIIPRAAVMQFLISKSLIKCEPTDIIHMLLYPEKTFLEKLMKYEEAPQLLMLYQEKLDLSNKMKLSV